MDVIYAIHNTTTNKRYIGVTSNWVQRWQTHRSSLRRGKHRCVQLQNDWNEMGESSFVFVRLSDVPENEAGNQEAAWMAYFYLKDETSLYNRCGGVKYAISKGLVPITHLNAL